MKIGQTSGPYSRYELKERYKLFRSHGYECIDYNLATTEVVPYTLGSAECDEYLREQRKYIEDAGIEITQTHGPWRWPPLDDTAEGRAERLEKMSRCLHMTAVLGCPYMVVHPIMPFGINDIGTVNVRATYEMNLDFYTKLLKVAHDEGVSIALENMPMPNFSIGSPTDIKRMVDALEDDSMVICLDTGHVTMFKDTTPANAVRELGSIIKVLHVHDNDGKSDLHKMPFDGVIDWSDFAHALREVGYDGCFSLETSPFNKLPTPIYSRHLAEYAVLARYICEDMANE